MPFSTNYTKVCCFILLLLTSVWCTATETKTEEEINELEEPLYTPFIERYVLDELKQLRTELANTKHELMQQILDREHSSVDRAVTYATDTVTYFFYLIAGVSSILVLVGWTSIRDIKEKVQSIADEKIHNLVTEYEARLDAIEQQLKQKTRHIEENRDEIELTQEVQSLWLRAQQENSAANRIAIYDQILKLKPEDCEALTYKADSVLELNEPQWAVNLCNQALTIDPGNSHAFYQLACAHTVMGYYEDAIDYLSEAIALSESFRDDIETDPALVELRELDSFKNMLSKG